MTWIILINSPLFRDKIENYDEDSPLEELVDRDKEK